MNRYNLVSAGGVFILIFFSWLFSAYRKQVNMRVIVCGLALQCVCAVFIFCVPMGVQFFLFMNKCVVMLLNASSAGTEFVFGRLALSPGTVNQQGESSLGFFLAFQGLPTIIFFSSLMAILYFYNIIPVVIRFFSRIFGAVMKVSGAESLVAASNIFVGIESAFTVRPHLNTMTRSELCTVLSAGMATVASNVLALYVYSLRAQFPNIAGHLVSASLLSAPAALMMSKILLPETEQPKTLGVVVAMEYEKENSVFEAVINGAQAGAKMIVGIAAVLIAVLGLVAVCDLLLSSVGSMMHALFAVQGEWSLKGVCGYVFYPFTLVMGVPFADTGVIAKIIGERIIVTEVVAYQDLARVLQAGGLVHPRSAVIATYALCGFAHVASLAIFVGGLSALAPTRVCDIAQVAPRALCAATLACFLTACIAGIFFTNSSLLLGAV